MPRPRTPLIVAEATGAIDKNRKRFAKRLHAPEALGPVGEPPNYFDELHRDMWNEIVALPAPGVLTSADRILVEITAKLLFRFRLGGTEDADGDKIPFLSPVELGHLRASISSMGCTPADRTRVISHAPEAKEDPLADFLGGSKQPN